MLITVEITPAQAKYLEFLEAHKVKKEEKEYLTQNQAYLRFGRANVDLWTKKQIVQQHQRNRCIEYKLKELLEAAERIQEL